MDEFKTLTSSEWGAPYQGRSTGTEPLNGVGERSKDDNREISVAAVLERDAEKQINGVDIQDELAGSFDNVSAYTEEERELAETEAVARTARANQG
jgi:hypothetical protein